MCQDLTKQRAASKCQVMGRQSKKEIPLWWGEFMTEYLKNGQNAAKAYRQVRPEVKAGTAKVESCKLLTHPNFLTVLNKAKAKLEAKAEMSREEWFRKLKDDAADCDLRDFIFKDEAGDLHLVDEWKKLPGGNRFQKLEVMTTTGEEGQVFRRVKLTRENRNEALKILGSALGYSVERIDVTSGGERVGVVEIPALGTKPDGD